MTRHASPCWCGRPRSAPAIKELVARTGWTEANVAASASRASLMAVADSWYVDAGWFGSARGQTGGRGARVSSRESFGHRNRQTGPCAPVKCRAFRRSCWTPCSPRPRKSPVEGETVRLRSHTVVLQEDEERARAAIERTFEAAGLAAPAWPRRWRNRAWKSAARALCWRFWCVKKRLLRINEELVLHSSAIERLRQILAPRKSQYFGVGEFKEWTGISRKYAIPLLEYLDASTSPAAKAIGV